MRMFRTAMVLMLLLTALTAGGQTITGKVRNSAGRPLTGAKVYALNSDSLVLTDSNGFFRIHAGRNGDIWLIAAHPGYQPDTLAAAQENNINFVLQEAKMLGEVIIQAPRDGIIISDNRAIKTEQITQVELAKSACCDLAGCFETQTTVQPQTTNVITNSRELRILGLSGVYNQILLDGFPMIQGLTYTYGISSIPGTIVDNIYVAKGANSVLQGFESISGQINVETKEPDKTERLLLNAYLNSFNERHLNANYAAKLGRWSSLTSLHIVQPANRIDRDGDNLMDLPRLTRYLISSKWKYGDEKVTGWNSRIGFRALREQRIGGQTAYNPARDKGSMSVYGQSVEISQPELWTKTGYRFNEKHRIVLFASAFHQNQHSYFGTVRYLANQTNFYANIQHELEYGSHNLKAGISYRYLNLNEAISFTDTFLPRTYNGQYRRRENIPGVFAENNMQFLDGRLTWIAGIRMDHHNRFGMQLTPRSLLKYDLSENTIIRGNIGTGWRTVNLFSENIGLLVSSRDILFVEELRPEKALNYGVNLTHKFDADERELSGQFSLDFYRTDFSNQIFPDYDTDPRKAIIKNFAGTSISNGFQAELLLKFRRRLELKTGYNFLDVYRITAGVKQLLPFNPRHKILGTFSYKPLNNKFHIDFNVHNYGAQRLPNTQSNPAEFRRPDFSRPYTLVNGQFTWNFKQIEVYTGCENIFDFRQLQPVISWQNPFSSYFDTSSVWGPTRGREVYIGVRIKLKQD